MSSQVGGSSITMGEEENAVRTQKLKGLERRDVDWQTLCLGLTAENRGTPKCKGGA